MLCAGARSKTRSLVNSLMNSKCWSGWKFVAMICIQYPSSSRSNCLLNPLNGTVSRASGHVLGTLASVWRVANPPSSGRPGTSSLVWPARFLSKSRTSTPSVDLPNSLNAFSNLFRSDATFAAKVRVGGGAITIRLSGTFLFRFGVTGSHSNIMCREGRFLILFGPLCRWVIRYANWS